MYYEPIHFKTYYKEKYKNVKLSNTENISKSILTLPIFPSITNNEIKFIANKIKIFFNS